MTKPGTLKVIQAAKENLETLMKALNEPGLAEELGIEQDPEVEEVEMDDSPGSPLDKLLSLMSLSEDTANAVCFFFDRAGGSGPKRPRARWR
jgi:hypothetical protein